MGKVTTSAVPVGKDPAVRETTLGDIGQFLRGKGIPRAALAETGLPCLRYGDIYTTYDNYVEILRSRVKPEAADRAVKLLPGDIVFTSDGETAEEIGKAVAYIGKEPAFVGDHSIILRDHGQDPVYLGHLLNSHGLKKQKSRMGKGASIVGIRPSDLAKLRVMLPAVAEQRKIAAVFRTWDDACNGLEALGVARQQQYAGLTCLIHDAQIEKVPLREFVKEISMRNQGQRVQRVLSVTNSSGFVLAKQRFARRVASADLSNYKVVTNGQYAYNPARINVGSIARLDEWESGALSPMYVVFKVLPDLDSDYLFHWLQSSEAQQRIALATQGSVRKTVNFDALGSILIPLPSKKRQQLVSSALNAVRDAVRVLHSKCEALNRQKQALMQQLLHDGQSSRVASVRG